MEAEFRKFINSYNSELGLSGYVLENINSFEELLEFREHVKSQHTDLKPLLVLHDPNQAFYSSTRTIYKWFSIDRKVQGVHSFKKSIIGNTELIVTFRNR